MTRKQYKKRYSASLRQRLEVGRPRRFSRSLHKYWSKRGYYIERFKTEESTYYRILTNANPLTPYTGSDYGNPVQYHATARDYVDCNQRGIST